MSLPAGPTGGLRRLVPGTTRDARRKASAQDFDAALVTTDSVLQADPGNSEAWLLKGDLLQYGKADDAAAKPAANGNGAGNGQYVILIGAFSNPANVKQLQTKIGELGVKVYTEPLDSPGGKKTRVRAGPFANRDAADKALDKLKRIGVNGVVAAR